MHKTHTHCKTRTCNSSPAALGLADWSYALWSPLCMVCSSLPGPPSIWVHVALPSTDNTQPPVSCLFHPPSSPPSAFLPRELGTCCVLCLQRSVPSYDKDPPPLQAVRVADLLRERRARCLLCYLLDYSLPWCWGRRNRVPGLVVPTMAAPQLLLQRRAEPEEKSGRMKSEEEERTPGRRRGRDDRVQEEPRRRRGPQGEKEVEKCGDCECGRERGARGDTCVSPS